MSSEACHARFLPGNNRLRTTGRYWMDLIPFNTFSAWSNGSHYTHCHRGDAAPERPQSPVTSSKLLPSLSGYHLRSADSVRAPLLHSAPEPLWRSFLGVWTCICVMQQTNRCPRSLLQKTPPSSLFWRMSLHFNVLFNVINSHGKYLSSIKCTATLQKKSYQLQRDLLCLFRINSDIRYSFLCFNLCLLTYQRHT